jgi:hypothetical protein
MGRVALARPPARAAAWTVPYEYNKKFFDRYNSRIKIW